MTNKKFFTFICAVIIFLVNTVNISAYEYSEFIKIGLLYGSKAVSNVKVNFSNGINCGFENENGVFTSLFTNDSINDLMLKKSTQFHLKLSSKFDTYSQAFIKAEEIRKLGLATIIAYQIDGFYLWIGNYNSENEAIAQKTTIENKISSNLTVVKPSDLVVEVSIGDQTLSFFAFEQTEQNYLLINNLNSEGRVAVNNVAYRGGVMAKRLSSSDMTIINVVNLDEYLYSVVGAEMSPSWHIEALKSQAVASRGYALSNWNKYKKYGFNLDSTTNSQAYYGTSKEKESTIRAVNETKGRVVLYNGKPAQTIFGAMNGGKTANSSKVWGGTEIPYLTTVVDPYEKTDELNHKYAIWKIELTPQQIKEKLASKKIDIGDIIDVVVTEKDSSDRVNKLKIVGINGEYVIEKESTRTTFSLYSQTYKVYKKGSEATTVANDIYMMDILGNNKINLMNSYILSATGLSKNTSNTVSVLSKDGISTVNSSTTINNNDPSQPIAFVFDGRGWGHGVGMSQYGAKAMAEKGFTYDKILLFYYPGTQLSE